MHGGPLVELEHKCEWLIDGFTKSDDTFHLKSACGFIDFNDSFRVIFGIVKISQISKCAQWVSVVGKASGHWRCSSRSVTSTRSRRHSFNPIARDNLI